LNESPICNNPFTLSFFPSIESTDWLSDDGSSINIQSIDLTLAGLTQSVAFYATVTQDAPVSTTGHSMDVEFVAPDCGDTIINT